jgi:N-acetylneuraminic acid mutarotase
MKTSNCICKRPRTLGLLIVCLAFSQGVPAAAQGTWTTKAPMLTPGGGAVGAANGILYDVGGVAGCCTTLDVVQAYDPGTDSWTYKAPVPTTRVDAGVGTVDGILYVTGGVHMDAFSSPILDSVEAYDPKTNTWTTRPHMPTPREGMGVAVLNGILYAVGGRASSVGTVGTVEAYNPRTNTWTTKAPLPTPRAGLAVVAAGDILYAFGGGNPSMGTVSTVEDYDPKTNTWSTRAPMPTARGGMAAGVINGVVYVVGGLNPKGQVLDTVEAYDPSANSWSIVTPMPVARAGLGAAVVDDVLCAVGGGANGPGGFVRFALNEAFSPFLPVAIDIKPGDASNTINLKSGGVIPVAVLGSATFDPMTVDPATVTLAGAPVATRGRGAPMTSASDVNHDGFPDLLLFFRTQDLKVSSADTQAVLYGETYSGQKIRGADAVRIVPPTPKPSAAQGRLAQPRSRRG